MPIKLYKLDASPPVRAVLMTADIIQLDYETEEVNLAAGEHLTPEYLKKNPLHTVPLLEDSGFFLADSHPIITYLVSKYGGQKHAKLYPSDLAIRATIDQRLFFDNSVLFPPCKAIVGGIMRQGAPGPTPEQIEQVKAGYDILETYLKRTKFVACDHLTVADVSCVSTVSSGAVMVPIDAKYEKIHAWWNQLKKEGWYKNRNLPGLTQLEGFITSTMKKNSENTK